MARSQASLEVERMSDAALWTALRRLIDLMDPSVTGSFAKARQARFEAIEVSLELEQRSKQLTLPWS